MVDDIEEIDTEKQHISDEINAKMHAMNLLNFDLTEEEIEQYQGILESDSEDNDSLNEESEKDLSTDESIEKNANENNSDENDNDNDNESVSLQQNSGII